MSDANPTQSVVQSRVAHLDRKHPTMSGKLRDHQPSILPDYSECCLNIRQAEILMYDAMTKARPDAALKQAQLIRQNANIMVSKLNGLKNDDATLSAGESTAILANPEGLRLLMDYEDVQYSQAESMLGAKECGPWPTARWLALREMGRAIIAKDPDIWSEQVRQAFAATAAELPNSIPQDVTKARSRRP